MKKMCSIASYSLEFVFNSKSHSLYLENQRHNTVFKWLNRMNKRSINPASGFSKSNINSLIKYSIQAWDLLCCLIEACFKWLMGVRWLLTAAGPLPLCLPLKQNKTKKMALSSLPLKQSHCTSEWQRSKEEMVYMPERVHTTAVVAYMLKGKPKNLLQNDPHKVLQWKCTIYLNAHTSVKNIYIYTTDFIAYCWSEKKCNDEAVSQILSSPHFSKHVLKCTLFGTWNRARHSHLIQCKQWPLSLHYIHCRTWVIASFAHTWVLNINRVTVQIISNTVTWLVSHS